MLPGQLDLFELAAGPMLTPAQRRHVRGATPRHGYAGQPGSGAAGETCAGCNHIARFRKYRKCALRRAMAGWTHGRGTDILATAPACSHWERPAA